MNIYKILYLDENSTKTKYHFNPNNSSVNTDIGEFLKKEFSKTLEFIKLIQLLEVGSGVTQRIGSDSYPYTIIEIINSKKIVIQADDYEADKTKNFNYYSNQVYKYSRNTTKKTMVLTLRKNGSWLPQGANMKSFGSSFTLGIRIAYQDPSF